MIGLTNLGNSRRQLLLCWPRKWHRCCWMRLPIISIYVRESSCIKTWNERSLSHWHNCFQLETSNEFTLSRNLYANFQKIPGLFRAVNIKTLSAMTRWLWPNGLAKLESRVGKFCVVSWPIWNSNFCIWSNIVSCK